MKRGVSFFLVLFLLLTSGAATARKHKKSGETGKDTAGKFDYYLLSLSWAPNYCAGHPDDRSSECKPGRHVTFVLHGLWPQSNTGAPPMSCAPARPVAKAVVDQMLEYMPSRGLIQHEWEKHGTCSGLSAGEYFARAEQAFKAVKVPDQYTRLDRSQNFDIKAIEQSFAEANGAPADAFRISCHNTDLVSVEACLDKDLRYQACSKTVRECRVSKVRMLPSK